MAQTRSKDAELAHAGFVGDARRPHPVDGHDIATSGLRGGRRVEEGDVYLWHSSGYGNAEGVHRVTLPIGRSNGLPFPTPPEGHTGGFPPNALAIRYAPSNEDPTEGCSDAPHVVNTWQALHQVCRTAWITVDGEPVNREFCVELRGLPAAPNHYETPVTPAGEPFLGGCIGIDVVPVGLANTLPIGDVGDVIVSDFSTTDQYWRIRRGVTERACDTGPNTESFLQTLYTFNAPVDVDGQQTTYYPIVDIPALAVGDFNGGEDCAVYYLVSLNDGSAPFPWQVRRLRWDVSSSAFVDEFFVDLPETDGAMTIEFDSYALPDDLGGIRLGGSGDLFVAESAATDARIWRIDSAGNRTEFGSGFMSPNGIAFHQSGAMLIAQDDDDNDNLLYVDLRRRMFNRGDANADGELAVSDMVRIYDFLGGGVAPPCLDAADINDDSVVDYADGSYLSDYLFSSPSGPHPPAPFVGAHPTPGWCSSVGDPTLYVDPTGDSLGCMNYMDCDDEVVW